CGQRPAQSRIADRHYQGALPNVKRHARRPAHSPVCYEPSKPVRRMAPPLGLRPLSFVREASPMVLSYQERRAERLQRRLEELRAWRNAREVPIADWEFTPIGGTPRLLHLGDFWPEVTIP